jgi:hypothetical protein
MIAIYATVMICTNHIYTILDDESTIVAVAGHPTLPTIGLFLSGGHQHEHPPHNSISQDSIPHDRLCQSALPACSTHVFPGVCAQHAEQLQDHVQRHSRAARLQTAQATAHSFPSLSATMAAPKSI